MQEIEKFNKEKLQKINYQLNSFSSLAHHKPHLKEIHITSFNTYRFDKGEFKTTRMKLGKLSNFIFLLLRTVAYRLKSSLDEHSWILLEWAKREEFGTHQIFRNMTIVRSFSSRPHPRCGPLLTFSSINWMVTTVMTQPPNNS